MVGKHLVTEGDVLALERGTVLRIDSRTIATPAALDAAHGRGIRVVYGDAEGGGCSSGEGDQECLWHRLLATDGTYVVRISAGRATIDQLTDRGPVRFGTDSAEDHQ